MANRSLTLAIDAPATCERRRSPLLAIALSAALAFAALGLFVLERRATGGFVPQGGAAAATALTLVAWGAALRAVGRRATFLGCWTRWFLDLGVSCGIVGIGLGLAAGDALGALVVVAVLAETASAWWFGEWAQARQGSLEPLRSPAAGQIAAEPVFAADGAQPSDDETDQTEGLDDEQLDPRVQQMQTRSRGERGEERISGWQRAGVPAGAQSVSAHVAFCPPLERVPQLQVHQLEGPDAQIKVAVAQPFGARFDLRLSKPAAADCEVVLEYTSDEPA